MPDVPPLWQLAGRSPADPAVSDPVRSETWSELDERTNAVGHGVESMGLEPGQHVTLVAGNRVEFVDVVLGVQRAGMVVSPLKTSWTPAEIAGVLADAGTRLVATDTDNGRRAAAEAAVPVIDLGQGFERWLAAQDRSPLPADRRGWRMSYTSGTTGRPKGVVHADSGELPFSTAFARSAVWARAARMPADGPHLVASHLFHGAPLTFGLSALANGSPLVVLGRWDPSWCLHRLGDGVASTAMVPTMFRQLLGLPADERASFDAPALGTVLHGGEPCPPDLKARMVEWWGPVFVEYFGFSEGGMTLATTEEWERRPGTVGHALPHQEILVLDDEARPLPPRSEGLVYFRSLEGQRFRYHNDPARTAGAYGPDGAFTAGDIGWLDEDGYLFISGRQADVIVSAGVNVYPAEVEAVISAIPAVADVAVVGGPHPERGEEAVAFVVLQPGADPDPSRTLIATACEGALAGYKRPRRILIRPALPRDATGKLLRNPLRDELWGGRSGFAAPEAGVPRRPW